MSHTDASANCISAPGAAVLAAGLHTLEPGPAKALEAATHHALAHQPHATEYNPAPSSVSLSTLWSQPPSLTNGAALLAHATTRARKGVGAAHAGAAESGGRQRGGGGVQERGGDSTGAAGARSCLHTMLLGSNPLGCDGVILLLKVGVWLAAILQVAEVQERGWDSTGAAGARSCLHTLLLGSNPLGCNGVIFLLKVGVAYCHFADV